MGDNGTATLHHPKYFAPLNLSTSNPNTAAEKRSLLPPASLGDIHNQQAYISSKNPRTNSEESYGADWTGKRGFSSSEFLTGSVVNDTLLTHNKGMKGIHLEENSPGNGKGPREGKRRRRSRPDGDMTVNTDPASAQNPQAKVDVVDADPAPSGRSGPPSAFQLSEEHFRGIILTILGVALLDFNCDACQSPCR